MGMLLCGDGLWTWQDGWHPLECALSRVDLAADGGRTLVDNTSHRLLHQGRIFPCDRDIEALAAWKNCALLLSSDTDCLSLWDGDGLVRTARVGVYPQDMAVHGSAAYVCGGTDGRVHRLDLPGLHSLDSYALPGMTERISLHGDTAYILSMQAENDVHTLLAALDLCSGEPQEIARFTGLPGALTADAHGLWVGVSETLLHLPYGTAAPDLLVEGFGLPRHISVQDDTLLVTDPVAGLWAVVQQGEHPLMQTIRHDVIGQGLFLP